MGPGFSTAPRARRAGELSIRESRRNRVSLVGIGLGVLSLGLKFVVVKPNRIATGTGFFFWQVLSPPEVVLLVVPWIAALLLFLVFPSDSPYSDGILGNLVIVVVFLLVGRITRAGIIPDAPFSRTSMAIGSWTMLLGGYALVLSALERLAGKPLFRVLISLAGFAAVVVLFAGGYLNELSIVQELSARRSRFLGEFARHMSLSLTAVAVAILIGTPLGVVAYRKRLFERPVFFFVNTVQTIPSLALFGLMIAPLALLSNRFPLLRELGVRGIGSAPAIIALTLYALLPITRNTYTSLRVLDPSVIESARGMGMGRFQLLFLVEIPLSVPIILSGIRISMVQAVGNTAVAALIGAGGFGVFVFQGLGQGVADLILLGAFPVILLAVAVDKGMQLLVTAVTPRGISVRKGMEG
jgi:osmoprotectant transport system permease protein